MAEMDQRAREALHSRAWAAHRHLEAYAERRAADESTAAFAHSSTARSRASVPDGSAAVHVLCSQDAPQVIALATADRWAPLPADARARLEQLRTALPRAIEDSTPPGLLHRLLRRGPTEAVRAQATDFLVQGVTELEQPATVAALQIPPPLDPRTTDAGVLSAAIAQRFDPAHASARALTTADTAQLAQAVEDLVGWESEHRGALERVRRDAEATLAAVAHRMLAEVDLPRLKSAARGIRVPVAALQRAGINDVASLLDMSRSRLAATDGISETTATALLREAEQLRSDAHAQARLDLTDVTAPHVSSLLTALKLALDSRWRLEGADDDLATAQALRPALHDARSREAGLAGTFPLGPALGPQPAVLSAVDSATLESALARLGSLIASTARRAAGAHLDEARRARLGTDPITDAQAHPSDAFGILVELGFEDRITTDSHGDLPERLVRLIDEIDLDTSRLRLNTLRRYQHFAARFVLQQKRVIIGDEMGLGKTIEALAAIAHLSAIGSCHALVIAPAAVLSNWVREIETRTDLHAHLLHGTARAEATWTWQQKGGVGVTTFDTLSKLPGAESFTHLDAVVVDEAHKIKNPHAKRSIAAAKQIRSVDHAILMTGTPLENRVEEFHTLVSYLDSGLARSAEGLLPAAFREHVAPVYLRRNQDDVLKELPELNEIQEWIPFSPDDRSVYERAVADGNFMAMRQAAMRSGSRSLKIQRLVEIVEDALGNGRKVLVFSYFRATLDTLMELLPGPLFGPLSGSVAPGERQRIVDDFSTAGGGAVLISQIQAGGEGLNIQAASVVVICEPQLKPSLEVQAIARAHRMGQARSVQVHRLLSDEGVDRGVVEMLRRKTEVFDEYARESAAKASDADATATQEIAIQKTVLAEERRRLGLAGASPEDTPSRGMRDPEPAPRARPVPEPSATPARPLESTEDDEPAALGDVPAEAPGHSARGYAVIDLETTGLSPSRHHRVLELGVVLLDADGQVEEEWSTLINPGRDIPNSHIHGITPSDIVHAPCFTEIAPRLVSALDGRLLVAHNAPFDMVFLEDELRRAGFATPVDDLPYLCTMHWSGAFLDAGSRRLADCCAAAGIDLSDAHSAAADTRAAAGLLQHYLSLLDGSPLPWQEDLDAAAALSWDLPEQIGGATADLVGRDAARGTQPDAWLSRIVGKMPQTSDISASAYLSALELALLDQVLAEHEKDELVAVAEDLGLSREQVLELHRAYLETMAGVALEDGVVTAAESSELFDVAGMLGLQESDVEAALQAARSVNGSTESSAGLRLSTAGIMLEEGDRVVFTGKMRRERSEWESLARSRGLVPGSITRSTRLVIAADPNSQSGKAAKARAYRVPIISEDAWERIFMS